MKTGLVKEFKNPPAPASHERLGNVSHESLNPKARFLMLSRKAIDIKIFHLFSCPRCSAQKFKARLNAWFVIKTLYIDFFAEIFPAVIINQIFQYRLQRFAMQRIIGLLFHNQN
jgi:hypothetical protein